MNEKRKALVDEYATIREFGLISMLMGHEVLYFARLVGMRALAETFGTDEAYLTFVQGIEEEELEQADVDWEKVKELEWVFVYRGRR